MTSALRFAFLVGGESDLDGATYVVDLDPSACRPPAVPRLTGDHYREAWVRACALEAVRRAYANMRLHRRIPDHAVAPPFVAVRDGGALRADR